ncbi:MAG: three-helix bundle dimerization domain-containing protein [Sporichthyaceae bacterium]
MSPTLLAAVVDNPVIDQQWYAGELSSLHGRLAARFPQVPGDVIATALELATERIAVSARVPNYLPVLLERDARAQIATYLAGEASGL